MALAVEDFAPLADEKPLLDRDAPADLVPRALLLPLPPPEDAEGVPACFREGETETDGEMEGRGGALRLADGEALWSAVGLPREALGRRETVPPPPLAVACTEAIGEAVSDTCPLGDLEALEEADTEALRVEEAVMHWVTVPVRDTAGDAVPGRLPVDSALVVPPAEALPLPAPLAVALPVLVLALLPLRQQRRE